MATRMSCAYHLRPGQTIRLPRPHLPGSPATHQVTRVRRGSGGVRVDTAAGRSLRFGNAHRVEVVEG